VKEVFLNNLITKELKKIGEAVSNDKALDLAKASGLVPKGWNTPITDVTDEQIIVTCTKGAICSGYNPGPSVTPPKPKS
jgi:hypothetical protein